MQKSTARPPEWRTRKSGSVRHLFLTPAEPDSRPVCGYTLVYRMSIAPDAAHALHGDELTACPDCLAAAR